MKTLKALNGPYADIRFMPTGGINLENMNDYLALSNVTAVGGSFMTPSAAVKAKDWTKVSEACRTALAKVQG